MTPEELEDRKEFMRVCLPMLAERGLAEHHGGDLWKLTEAGVLYAFDMLQSAGLLQNLHANIQTTPLTSAMKEAVEMMWKVLDSEADAQNDTRPVEDSVLLSMFAMSLEQIQDSQKRVQ